MPLTPNAEARKTASREKLADKLRQAWYLADALSFLAKADDREFYSDVKGQLAILGLLVTKKKNPVIAETDNLTVDPLSDVQVSTLLDIAPYPCSK